MIFFFYGFWFIIIIKNYLTKGHESLPLHFLMEILLFYNLNKSVIHFEL